MSYGPPAATRLYKYQWDQIQSPALALFGWMEREEEGEMALPCVGLFDDCHFVVAMLDSLRNCRLIKEKFRIRGEKNRYTGKYVKIGDYDYDFITLDFADKGEIESDPFNFSSYDKDYMDEYRKINYRRVFFAYAQGKELAITIADTRENRKDLLEEYLFGIRNEQNGNNQDVEILKHASGREYGWLSAEQESGADAGCAIGYDDKGGCSYGKHQIAVHPGTLKDFIRWANEKTNNRYACFTDEWIKEAGKAGSKKSCEKCELTKKWIELCHDEDFNNLQHNFILETLYKPNYDKIMRMFGNTKLFSNMHPEEEEALKEMCISLGVQHGGAFRIFEMALLKDFTGCSDKQILEETTGECSPEGKEFPAAYNKNQGQIATMNETAGKLTMSEFIDRVYAARKLYVKAYKVENWENMVKNRYKIESSKLNKILNL